MQEIMTSLGGLCEHVTKMNTSLITVEKRFEAMEKIDLNLHIGGMKLWTM